MCESTLTNMVSAQRDTRTYTITHTVHDIKQQYGIMPGVYMVHEARKMDGTWIMGGRRESRMGRNGLTGASRLEHLGCGVPAAETESPQPMPSSP